MPTIKDVAREADVSIATVSYVLNGKTHSISSETQQLVLETAKRIGYTPNSMARNLRYNQTRLLGYAWRKVPQDQISHLMNSFAYHLAHSAEKDRYHIMTFTHEDDAAITTYDDLISSRRVDGFILSDVQQYDERISTLIERHFPFVAFGRTTRDDYYPWVDVDGFHGVRTAVRYLVERGHRQIGMVVWEDGGLYALHNRLQGYYAGMAEAGIAIADDWVYRGNPSEKTGRAAFHYWNALPQDIRPTAIITISDLEAIGVVNAAHEHGIVVGQDLSVIGFDDVPTSQFLRPALTTIRQPIAQIAQELIRLLNTIIDDPQAQPAPVLLKPTLVERDSCHTIP